MRVSAHGGHAAGSRACAPADETIACFNPRLLIATERKTTVRRYWRQEPVDDPP